MATTLQGAPEGEGQQQTPPAGQPADSSGQDDSVQGLSVEDVDSRWRHRVSQKDKAHAAAEQALREENDKLRSQLSRTPSSGQSGTAPNGAAANASNGDAEYWREQATQREREVEQERQLRAAEQKRAKFPALAAQVGEAGSGIFATADDATLARLNALADDEASGSTFAPTTPRKAAPGKPKSINEMDKAELEQELARSVARGDHNR